MKHCCLFLAAAFSCIASVSHAQNEYLQNNPVWKMTSHCAYGYPCITHTTYNYYVDGDTVINSVLYKQVFSKGSVTYSWMANPPVSPGCNVNGGYTYVDASTNYFVRSAGKQMYISFAGNPEQLLYDFDLDIGDTLPLSYTNAPNNIIVVTNIDSFFTPHGYRKRFHLSGDTWSQYLIEGVGHSFGLFEPMQVPFECGYDEINCFSYDSAAWYPQPGPYCDLPLSAPTLIQEEKSISLFPNPASGALNISVTGGTLLSCTIHDQLGRSVLRKNSTAQLDIAALAPGVYVATIELEDGTRSRKMFVKE